VALLLYLDGLIKDYYSLAERIHARLKTLRMALQSSRFLLETKCLFLIGQALIKVTRLVGAAIWCTWSLLPTAVPPRYKESAAVLLVPGCVCALVFFVLQTAGVKLLL